MPFSLIIFGAYSHNLLHSIEFTFSSCSLLIENEFKKIQSLYFDVSVFSTSEKYGVIYNYYGLDKSKYFNVKYTVEQSSEDASCMLLKGYVEPKEFEGTVLYSEIVYYMEFLVNRDGKNIIHGNNETIIDVMSFNRGFLIDKIEGVDHKQTSSFIIQDFYIFYEKE